MVVKTLEPKVTFKALVVVKPKVWVLEAANIVLAVPKTPSLTQHEKVKVFCVVGATKPRLSLALSAELNLRLRSTLYEGFGPKKPKGSVGQAILQVI